MALCNSKFLTHFKIQQSQPILFLSFLRLTVFLFLLFPFANSISFNFPRFQQNDQAMYYQGNASIANDVIQLTQDQLFCAGRATYAHAIHLWDSKTRNLTDFNTQFSFIIKPRNLSASGDGLAFFLSPVNDTIPDESTGGLLGLFEDSTAALNDTNKQIVAVEFDTVQNAWDPSSNHVGIDINSNISVTTWNISMKNGITANAWVNYNSTTTTLSVYLMYDQENPTFQGDYSLSYVIDLREVLPEWVSVGFSAATGVWSEAHDVVSWTFNSTLSESMISSPPQSTGTGPSASVGHKMNVRLVVGLVMSIGGLIFGVGLFLFIKWNKIKSKINSAMGVHASDHDDDLEEGTGPRRFTFRELSHATNNFFEGGKLGQGGFGGVYKGMLSDTQEEIAVKRISRGSKQGRKEFKSEVKIISRLRHRNLVQLIGWCHEQGEFLLVYKFMSNGSLDYHLFHGKSKLTWTVRYKIALDLASALVYLHEGWEQCVIHRDIKSSNIMLDSNYNAKLGDFGLARLVDHERHLDTTDAAGMLGYMAPEYADTGKASKESDVFSFGIVALEIACGRKPVERDRDPGQVGLLEWVWSLFEKGQLFEAVYKDLPIEYDQHQVERLMLVGLWCSYPDFKLRPSIRQVISSLKFEASIPVLPTPVHFPSFMCVPCPLVGIADQDKDRNQCSSSTHAGGYYSSLPVESSKAPLQLDEDNIQSILQ